MQRYRIAKQGGVALVELALVVPFLLLLSIVTTDLGRAIYQYQLVTKSVRNAARYAAQVPAASYTDLQNLIVYGTSTGGGSPIVPGLALAHVQQPQRQTVGTVPAFEVVTVTVSGYGFQSMFSSVFGVAFGDFTYNDISATMRAPT